MPAGVAILGHRDPRGELGRSSAGGGEAERSVLTKQHRALNSVLTLIATIYMMPLCCTLVTATATTWFIRFRFVAFFFFF